VLDPIEDPEVGYRIARRALSEAQAWRGAEAKMTNDGTLPDRLRNMVRNPNAIGTHSAACWQWHDDCALLLAADRVAERDADVSAGAVARTVAMSHIAAERDAERAARERAEADRDRFREHSILLNRVCWKLLEATGRVGPDDDRYEHHSDEECLEMVAELVERLDDAQLRSIEARNPGIDMDEVRASRERERDLHLRRLAAAVVAEGAEDRGQTDG